MKLYQTKTEHPLNLTPQKWVLTVQYRAPTGDCCCFLVLYIKNNNNKTQINAIELLMSNPSPLKMTIKK